MVEAKRSVLDPVSGQWQTSCERRLYISSLSVDPELALRATRRHWGVESMHWSLDVVFGTLATLLACLATAALGLKHRERLSRNILACLMPVAFNAVIVGALIACFETDEFLRGAFWPAFGLNALTVGFGELVVMLLLGLPLLRWLPRSKFMSKLQENIEESD